VGEGAAHALLAAGWSVRATMRREHARIAQRLSAAGASVERLDLEDESWPAGLFEDCDAAVLTPMLTLSARLAERLREAGVARVAAFSSNNVALLRDAPKYQAIARAEAQLRAALPGAVVIRPTLIYGDPRLTTLAQVMSWARRWPVLPAPGSGRALQQPVFHEDLARLAAALAQDDAHAGKTFAVGGPDIVSMRALFEACARAAGAPRAIVPVPLWALSLAALAAPGLREMQIAQLERDKLAIEVDRLDAALAPRVGLSEGLARLARAMGFG
jgi:uncharacterized protein YbjT (DUF2867 family)